MSFRNAVLRAVPGAFILNSGIGKLGMPAEVAEGMQKKASTGIPQLAEMPAEQFGKLLAYGEIAVGAALLLPFVPTRLAGAALATFAGGLLSMYVGDPEMTESDGIRPSMAGTPLAKDSWLLAIGVALAVDPD